MKRYKVLNAKRAVLISIAAILSAFLLVFTVGHSSVLVKLEITLGMLALGLFSFFFVGLYTGLRLKHDPLFKEGWKPKGKLNLYDVTSGAEWSPAEFVGEGLLGIIVSVVVWILFSIVLILLLFLIGNMLWGLVFFLGVMLYWLFYRAYRNVFLKSRYCRNRFWRSAGYGAWFTGIYTGWAFLLLQAGVWFTHRQ